MKKFLLSGALLLGASISMFANFNSLVFNFSDGTSKSLLTAGLVITVNGNTLEVENSQGQSLSINTGKLISMQFVNNNGTGVKPIEFENSEVEVYNMEGVNLGKFSSIDSARDSLSNGVYILRNTKGETIKIVVKK